MIASFLTSLRPAVLAACGFLFPTFAAQAYPYDDSLDDLPPFLVLNGVEARTGGTDVIYNIPVQSWPDTITITARGGDGGRAKATAAIGSDQIAQGGGGAQLMATFAIDPEDADALKPGGEIRLVVGSRGYSQSEINIASGGGGGGTGVLYRSPEDGADWELLMLAGGGGGACASTAADQTFAHDGSNANTLSAGIDAGSASPGGIAGGGGFGWSDGAGGGAGWKQGAGGNQGGDRWLDGGSGGPEYGSGSDGGFGCGGGGGSVRENGATAHHGGGGGGGGYSGGGGGDDGASNATARGGGGGSFIDSRGTSKTRIERDGDQLNGSVQITGSLKTSGPLSGPTITLTGSSTVTISHYSTYTDAGASAVDVYGNTITLNSANRSSVSTVNEAVTGTYSYTYQITDQFGNTSTASRTVIVLANNKPTFSIDGDVTVDEDSGSFSRANFAYDIDTNDAHQTVDQFIVTTNNNDLFATQPAISKSGTLTFTPADDASGTAEVAVVAVDNISDPTNGSSDPVTFYLHVTGVDDPPVALGFVAGSLEENQTEAGTIGAVDTFGGDLSFILTGGADDGLFTLDETSGALSFLSPPDFENPSDSDQDGVYQVGVLVRGSDGDSTATFSFAVIDVNETPAAPTLSNTSVSENTTTVGTVSAIDPDNDTLTYAITGGADQALFQIDANTGALSFLAAPDYENPADADGDNVYQVEVGASDGVQVTSAFQIAVQDDTSTPTGITVSVSEIPEGQTDVGVVSATDPSGGEVTFAFGGGRDSSQFDLTPQGVLSFKNPPDFENPEDFDDNNIFALNIQATGSEGSVKVVRYLTVTDVDEAPSTPALDSTSIEENTTLISTLSASDPENQAVTYTITGGADQAMFTVSGEALSFLSAPDFETPADADHDGVYEVEITANDGTNDSPPASFSITVTDVEEADITDFRLRYGLASDGSDDNADWSQNGVPNLFYLAFGLGDPNNPAIDRSRLPQAILAGDTFAFSYVEPTNNSSGITLTPKVSTDLSQWQTPAERGELPTASTTEDLGDGYQRVTLTFPVQSSQRYFAVGVEED